MATTALAATSPTLLDVQKVTDPAGRIMPVVEALAQRNSLVQTMSWKEGNLDTGHRVALSNSLPSVQWIRLNEGISPSRGTDDTFDEQCGMLGGLSSIDVRVANLNGNAAAFRSSRDMKFVASLTNTLESAVFYETTTANPERILGLSPRLSASAGKYGSQLIKAGGASTDNASIWLIGWGDSTVYGISPRGQGTGLSMEDKGQQRTLDAAGGVLWKWETLFQWNCGLCVEDYRFVFRICNIPQSTLTYNAATGPALLRLMIEAYYGIYDPSAVRLCWYVNRRIAAWLHQQALAGTANATLSVMPTANSPGVFGAPITACMGAPIHVSDALTITEALAS